MAAVDATGAKRRRVSKLVETRELLRLGGMRNFMGSDSKDDLNGTELMTPLQNQGTKTLEINIPAAPLAAAVFAA